MMIKLNPSVSVGYKALEYQTCTNTDVWGRFAWLYYLKSDIGNLAQGTKLSVLVGLREGYVILTNTESRLSELMTLESLQESRCYNSDWIQSKLQLYQSRDLEWW